MRALSDRGWVVRYVRMSDWGDSELEARIILGFDRSAFPGFL